MNQQFLIEGVFPVFVFQGLAFEEQTEYNIFIVLVSNKINLDFFLNVFFLK